ncbi:ABC transporter permease [Paenibacillus sp. IB182496]|uniref:ABC transporter permease n=1 Tax=Paenibacillus sabuli TaxID=2772509 RepID=A0A927GU57_9BACL|nr:ABC transporter permease [Paenibacillus sabuli]MBD2847367.1 ABC transporter permease [Paenibacillus sabuli]
MNNNFWTVVGFTAGNKIRTKSFIVTTAIIAAILCIGVNLPYIISMFSGNSEIKQVGYVEGQVADVEAALQDYYAQQGEEADLQLVGYPDSGDAAANEQALREALRSEEIAGYLVFDAEASGGFPGVTYKSEKLLDNTADSLSVALQNIKFQMGLENAGLTEAQMADLLAPINVQTTQISVSDSTGEGKTAEQRGLAMGFVYAMMILLFMGIFVTSQLIASEITAEKSSRVMEILVTSVSPMTQMFGKIFGMFLVGLLQIGVYVVVAVVNFSLPHNKESLGNLNINLGDIDPMLYAYALLFFLMGYFLFAMLCAAVGSIVSRTEDLAQAMMPVSMLALAGFYIGIFGMTTPGSTLVVVTSFIPFFTPFAMFLRIGLTDPALWEVLLSIGVLALSIFVLGWLSARIYRTGVLMYGKRPSLKELRKAMKAYKV